MRIFTSYYLLTDGYELERTIEYKDACLDLKIMYELYSDEKRFRFFEKDQAEQKMKDLGLSHHPDAIGPAQIGSISKPKTIENQ